MPPRTGRRRAICLPGYVPVYHPGYTHRHPSTGSRVHPADIGARRGGPGLCFSINYGEREAFAQSFLFPMGEERRVCAESFRSPWDINNKDWIDEGCLPYCITLGWGEREGPLRKVVLSLLHIYQLYCQKRAQPSPFRTLITTIG